MPRVLSFRHARSAAYCFITASLAGCATSSDGSGWVGKTLESFGIVQSAAPGTTSELPGKMPKSRQITLRLHAAPLVNLDSSGRALAVVARIYRLRGASGMLQATYESLLDTAKDAPKITDEVIDVREVVLAPGERHEVVEAMPEGATHIAVVALLRSPDPQRWKFVFDARDAARTGLVIGLHACAMSVAQGQPLGVPSEARHLAGMRCPKA
jgi:type VI secretion system protein VasD